MVSGDRVTLAVEGNTVDTVNSAVYAMQTLQQEMSGEAEHTGLTSEDDITALVNELSWTFESNSKKFTSCCYFPACARLLFPGDGI